MERIEAELLIPGGGEPVPDGVVIIDGPAISFAGPARNAPPTPAAIVRRTETVMPGLWDCHGHFLGVRDFDLGKLPLEPIALRAARCARDLRSALDAGFTSVREVGGLGVDIARAVAEGVLTGPSIYAAGAILSPTGGHAACTHIRRPGSPISGIAAANCARPTGRTNALARFASSCGATRG